MHVSSLFAPLFAWFALGSFNRCRGFGTAGRRTLIRASANVFCLCRNVDTALFDLLSYFNAINEKQ